MRFGKSAEETVSCLSALPCVRMEPLGSHWTDFSEKIKEGSLPHLSWQIQVCLNWDRQQAFQLRHT